MAAGDNLPFRGYAVSLFDNGALHVLSGLPVVWQTDTIKCALITTLPDYDTNTTDLHWDDVSADEVSSIGTYPAGGELISPITVAWDNVTVKIDGPDITYAQDASNGFTDALWAIVYKVGGSAATSPLLLAVDLGGAVGNTTADYVLQWGATGILRLPITDGV